MVLRRLLAFIKRDFFIELSYKLNFLLSFFSIFVPMATFYFITKLFGHGFSAYLTDYGGLYFPFVFIGIVFSGYFAVALTSFSLSIRNEQMMGTLEAIFLTPTKPSLLIISMSLWSFLFTLISSLVYFWVGIIFFGIDLSNANFFAVAISFMLTVIFFSSIGIISASFVIVFKRGDPIALVISILFSFFSGVYFPIDILPNNLKFISYFIPMTYSLRSIRLAILQGHDYKIFSYDICMLLIFCFISLPLSLLIFKYALKKVKTEGSLSYY